MSKKTEAATADTLPPAPPEIVIDDSPEILAKLHEAGITATRDVNPGVILTIGAGTTRVFAGDSVRRGDGGVYITKKAPDA